MKSVLGSPWGTSGALGRTRCSRLAKCSRKRLRISFPVIRGRFSLGGQPLQPPTAFPAADIAESVVQAVGAALPELDPLRPQSVSTPIVGQGNISRILRVQLRDRFLEHFSRRDDATLSRGQRRQLRSALAGFEVGKRRLATQPADSARDAD